MDTAQLGEWSRMLVAGAIAAYVVAWLAYGAELVVRRRASASAASAPELAPAALALTPDHSTDAARSLSAPASLATAAGDASDDGGDEARADRMAGIGRSVFILGTILLAAGVLARTLAVERAPWANMHEFSITGALIAAVIFLGVARTRVGRALSSWLLMLLVVTLLLAVTVLYVPPGPLVPALESYWLVIHVGLAVVAFALFTVAAVVSGLQIASERALRAGRTSSLPDAGALDRLAYRLIAIAFPIWTLGPLILGAVWAEVSWGRYWGWDPKEVWALITWLAYAGYLHARATAGWKGTKASVVSLIGYATVLFSYFAVNMIFNGLHSYGGV
jgi:cytochrome c-type biogenesis protein CcsB